MKIHILLFYKFIPIKNPDKLRNTHLKFCKDLGLLGKVLIASEGINGSISGTKKQVDVYKKELRNNPLFSDIEFKEENSLHHPFNKMEIKLKNEIIRLDKKVDMRKKGKYITPKDFLSLYKKKEDVIILDARNEYESRVGKFKRAITSKIDSFREFPDFIDSLNIEKDKAIVMYCTGGIRCEKASAYMIEKGFRNVRQLHGGIIKFCQKYPDTAWEGKCFVFDKRLTSSINQKDNPINNCLHCSKPTNFYNNCKNKTCNKLIFLCPNCEKSQHGCCSQDCKKILLAGNIAVKV